MNTKTTKTPKKVAKKAAPKKPIQKGRGKNGLFAKGNQIARKWTEETIIPELEKILAVLTNDDSGDGSNPVRANDIKLAEEAVMCTDVCLNSWEYWNTTEFQKTLPKDSSVFVLIKRIKTICEYRLCYCGAAMDMFVLKNHYGYKDKTEQEITGKDGKDLIQVVDPVDISKLAPEVIRELLKAGE